MKVDKVKLSQWANAMYELLSNPPSKQYMFAAVNDLLDKHDLPIVGDECIHWTEKYN